MLEEKTYHIYFKGRCLFKAIDERQFKMVWELLNTEYNSELDYSEIIDIPAEKYIEHSY